MDDLSPKYGLRNEKINAVEAKREETRRRNYIAILRSIAYQVWQWVVLLDLF